MVVWETNIMWKSIHESPLQHINICLLWYLVIMSIYMWWFMTTVYHTHVHTPWWLRQDWGPSSTALVSKRQQHRGIFHKLFIVFSKEDFNTHTKMPESQHHVPSKIETFRKKSQDTGLRKFRYCLYLYKLWSKANIHPWLYMLETTNKEYCFEF